MGPHCDKSLMNISQQSCDVSPIAAFYRWGNRGLEGSHYMPDVKELLSEGIWI